MERARLQRREALQHERATAVDEPRALGAAPQGGAMSS
jgi:hypothetical protein